MSSYRMGPRESSFGLFLSHGLSHEGDDVGVVDEPVKLGVGECRISDELVPAMGG